MQPARKRPVRPSTAREKIPVIACFNRAKTPLGVDFDALLAALQVYVDRHVAPVWGTPAKLVRSSGFVKNAWALVFLDDVDKPGVTAYHDLTPGGLPLSKIFVRTSLDAGDPVSVSASHELVEMLVDPAVNMMARGPDAEALYCYEAADPVEDAQFSIRGIPVSDFVYPAYFEAFHKRGSAKFDHMGLVKRPFQMLPGGYQITFKKGEWINLHGSAKKRKKHAAQDRRGRRGERRKRPLKPADHKAIARHEAAAEKSPRNPLKKPARASILGTGGSKGG